MLKIKKLFEKVGLIGGVKEHFFWKKLHVLHDGSLFKVKQFIENHIRIKEASKAVCSK
jgi:hypothetical protein